MPKGHSLLEPRIAALELKTKLLETELRASMARILVLEHPHSTLAAPQEYRPQFDHWPNPSQR